MSRWTALAMACAVTGVALAGCATPAAPESAPQPPPISTPYPTPSGVQDPAEMEKVPPEEAPEDAQECKKSLRPGPLPQPGGAMPAGSAMERIQSHGQLIVAIGSAANLLAFRDPNDNGRIKGFEAEIAREIAFAIFGDREKVKFRALNLDDRFSAVRGKDKKGNAVDPVDLAIAATTITCQRKAPMEDKDGDGEPDGENVNFSAEYMAGQQRLLVRRDSRITGIKDLGGKKVCATANSVNLRPIANADVEPKPVPVAAPNTADCLLLLQQGQIDAVTTGENLLAGLKAQDPATKIVGEPIATTRPTGILISKDSPELVQFVNAVLERLIANGKWADLHKQWLEPQIGPANPPAPAYET